MVNECVEVDSRWKWCRSSADDGERLSLDRKADGAVASEISSTAPRHLLRHPTPALCPCLVHTLLQWSRGRRRWDAMRCDAVLRQVRCGVGRG